MTKSNISRRNVLLLTSGLLGTSGCLSQQQTEDELYEEWKENDDYPEDTFRNEYISRTDFTPYIDELVETTFGYYSNVESLEAFDKSYIEELSVEYKIESNEPMDVYIIKGNKSSELLEDPSKIRDLQHVQEYHVSDSTSYNKVIRGIQTFTIIIIKSGITPPSTLSEQRKFVEEYDEIIIESDIEIAGYIPFSEYKKNGEPIVMHEHERDEELTDSRSRS